ncbi:carbohydrate ABC transporter permease, partial [Paenibacillus sp. MCAF20]
METNKLNSSPVFSSIAYIVIGVISLITFIPFVVLIAGSFSAESTVLKEGFWFWPRDFSLDAYAFIFRYPAEVLSAYRVSIMITVIGTAIGLLFSTMAAYVLYRKEVKYRNALAFFLFFTTLFNGGLAPFYILVTKYLELKNTMGVLILLPMFNVMFVLI